jgi:O-methyltransferase
MRDRATTTEALLRRLIGTSQEEGITILRALGATAGLEGDVCEFGVAQGATSALMAHEIMPTASRLHLFDSFRGLPAPSPRDELLDDIFGLKNMEAYKGTMACGQEQVRARLAAVGFPEARTVIHAGFLAETLAGDGLPEAVRFAYVDLDLYEGTRQALDFLTRVCVPGAIVIVDDYDFFSSGVRSAVQEVGATGAWDVREPIPSYLHYCTMFRRPIG